MFGYTVVYCALINTISVHLQTVFEIVANLRHSFPNVALRLDFINFLLKCRAPTSEFLKNFLVNYFT